MASFEASTCHNCGRKIMGLKFSSASETICTNCANSKEKSSAIKNNSQKKHNLEDSIHIGDKLASNKLKRSITTLLEELYTDNHDKLIIICVGTDRSTGDALGPLTGSRLNKFTPSEIPVFGTLKEPVHATNLQEKMKYINNRYQNPFVLAIDAGLGNNDSIGSINIKRGPLKPGSGVNKDLPLIGNMHITGLVNIGGYMEYFVLQSTRLHLVMKMAKTISRGVNWGLKKSKLKLLN
ncbi:spore protease YyaC [Acetohalobium arabaticum]|uniref:Sporulation protein YyaC n=1 Tax=Acetohalobium arabaticum (strain ATCC 49924 / DSM 5501 / Z-7288) TaxID=574087 RepID=D9QUL6_ACEAZ|nr:spore protease YyaC [Acetohalobium arabaticum]ADL13817.1 sporulation protein YyaC [Acetohalobium arabaticum DSM 5501]